MVWTIALSSAGKLIILFSAALLTISAIKITGQNPNQAEMWTSHEGRAKKQDLHENDS